MRVAYYPGPPPSDPKQAGAYARAELERVSQHLKSADFLQLSVLHVAPEKPRAGMLAVADGTDWDPSGGAGLYLYLGGSWTKL